MAKVNGNGFLKYWPIVVAIAMIIANWAVQGRDVQNVCKTAEANEIRGIQNREDMIGLHKDVEYIKEKLNELEAANTQVLEWIRTSNNSR